MSWFPSSYMAMAMTSYNFLGCPPPRVPPSFAFHRHTNKLLFAGYLLANSKLLARSGSTTNNTLIASYLLFDSVSTFAPQNWPTRFWPVYCVTQPCSKAELEKSEGMHVRKHIPRCSSAPKLTCVFGLWPSISIVNEHCLLKMRDLWWRGWATGG